MSDDEYLRVLRSIDRSLARLAGFVEPIGGALDDTPRRLSEVPAGGLRRPVGVVQPFDEGDWALLTGPAGGGE
jgi:hypothetical protein